MSFLEVIKQQWKLLSSSRKSYLPIMIPLAMPSTEYILDKAFITIMTVKPSMNKKDTLNCYLAQETLIINWSTVKLVYEFPYLYHWYLLPQKLSF
jgi:hypothetical protein